jgi:hypothetical protein
MAEREKQTTDLMRAYRTADDDDEVSLGAVYELVEVDHTAGLARYRVQG